MNTTLTVYGVEFDVCYEIDPDGHPGSQDSIEFISLTLGKCGPTDLYGVLASPVINAIEQKILERAAA